MRKRAIAAAAAGRVRPGMTIILDTGTTTLEVAKAIAGVEGLTVLTNSLAIAAVLHVEPAMEVILLGGRVRRNVPDLAGPLTEMNLRHFRADLAFLGADAASPEGLYTTDMSIARGSQAMIEAAAERVAVLDSGKFAASALYRFAEWDSFGGVITDEALGGATREWLETKVAEVTLAPVAKEDGGA